jgi:parvulin-like peptidyl-prolyl isomerase
MSKTFSISQEEILHQIKLSSLIPTLVEGIMTRKIIANAAREQGIEVEPVELQQAADSFRVTNGLHSVEKTWLWLQKNGLSLDEFEELISASVISSKLAQHLFAEQVEPFFIDRQLDYTQVVMYEIVLDDEDLALELFYAIAQGEISFSEAARQYIQDIELRRCGGYQGILYRSYLKPEIAVAVFSATPPQLLKPIVTSGGVHLIMVEEFIRPQLNEQLCYKILWELFSQWLKLQLQFEVEIDSSVLDMCICTPHNTDSKNVCDR